MLSKSASWGYDDLNTDLTMEKVRLFTSWKFSPNSCCAWRFCLASSRALAICVGFSFTDHTTTAISTVQLWHNVLEGLDSPRLFSMKQHVGNNRSSSAKIVSKKHTGRTGSSFHAHVVVRFPNANPLWICKLGWSSLIPELWTGVK